MVHYFNEKSYILKQFYSNWDKMSVHRPDAFICNNCDNRFNNDEKKTLKEQVDGIFTTKTVCPKCLSPDIRTTITGQREVEY